MAEREASQVWWVGRQADALALVWGFAEATFFFIVPDVLITWLALRRGREAWHACLWALAGALIGGSAMWLWGRSDAATALRVLDAIPAITAEMPARVANEIQQDGAAAVLRGSVRGVPYKIYAVHAGAAGVPLGSFMAISVPARLARFIVVAALTVLACRMFRGAPLNSRRAIHLGLWTAFYAWYFWRFADAA